MVEAGIAICRPRRKNQKQSIIVMTFYVHFATCGTGALKYASGPAVVSG